MDRNFDATELRGRSQQGNGRLVTPVGSQPVFRESGIGEEEFREPKIGDLLKRLSSDTAHLVRQEIALAKTELRDAANEVRETAMRLAVAVAMGISGAIALVAFLVIALGDAMNNYWASSLIVGAVLLTAGVLLARRARASVRGKLGLPETKEGLRDDARWARNEVQNLKRELTA